MSGLDKTVTNAYYEIDIDHKTQLPRRIRVLLLTGRKGETEVKNKVILGGRHVAFNFEYKLGRFGKAKELEIPRAAAKLLAKR